MKVKPILAIVGPTAVGKTSVAIAVAQKVKGEIIGLDSRQLYRGMPIGTAQPSAGELEMIPHHLIAIREPHEIVSAGEYSTLVEECIVEIRMRGKEPIICGGAGLYLQALTKGIFEDSAADLKIREKLNEEYDQDPAALLKKLQGIDSEYGHIVHINNKKRLVRALEIFEITGKSPTEHFNSQTINPSTNHHFCVILLSMETRICNRTKKMLANSWIEETKALLEKYSEGEVHALDSIGYHQICKYLVGEYTLEEVEEEIILRTRQYAKRQLTWFRNRSNPIEIDVEQFESVHNIADEIFTIWKKYKSS